MEVRHTVVSPRLGASFSNLNHALVKHASSLMALSQRHIATVLHEAFVQYVAFLTSSRQHHEESLPRLGKGIETTVDLNWEQSFLERLGAAELCLRQSERIARDIGKWANEPVSDEVEQQALTEDLDALPVAERLEDIWSLGAKYENDEPFLDIFSGALIPPTTKYSAGPSGTQNQPLAETTSLQQSRNTQEISSLTLDQRRRNGKLPETPTKSNPISSRANIDRSSPGLAPPYPKPTTNTSESSISPSPSSPYSSGQHTPTSPESQASQSPSESAYTADFSRDITEALRLQAEWDAEDSALTQQLHFAQSLQNAPPSPIPQIKSGLKSNDAQLQADALLATKLATEFLKEDKADTQKTETDIPGDGDANFQYARQVWEEEERRAVEMEQALAEARRFSQEWDRQFGLEDESLAQAAALQKTWAEEERLAGESVRKAREIEEQWLAENTKIEEQTKFAQDLQHADEERMESIRRDLDMAKAEQTKWENDIRAEEEKSRREAEELRRHEEEARRREAERIAEDQRRARQQREDMERLEEAKRQRQLEARRLEAAARQAEADRKKAELQKERADAEKRARQVDCTACGDTGERSQMAMLPCNHPYCGECIANAFKSASASRTPFKCCNQTIPVVLASPWLPNSFTSSYALMILEQSTKNAVYCSNRSCSKFIPPKHVHGPLGICPSCRRKTCSACGNAEHVGVCPEDKDGMAVKKLAEKQGWKECPGCKQIVHRTEGCLHMTCRCRHQWCYNCLRDWSVCDSTCGRR